MSVWTDGRVVSADEAPFADDRGLLLGDGLFETIHVVGGTARFLDRHLARLAASAVALHLPTPPSLAETVAQALPALVLTEGSPGRGALRVTVTSGRALVRGLARGDGPASLVLSFAALADAQRGEPASPVTARIVTSPRIDPSDPLAGHKTLSRMAYVQARRAARDLGDDVALLTTIDGDVCEADAANLFVVVGETLVTPGLDRGVLPGITRARCLEALAAAGRGCDERSVSRSEIERARELFVTSSLDGVRPIRAVDGRDVTAPGPWARWLARCMERDGATHVELLPPGGRERTE